MTTIAALLRLARISNLPTVWSNVLAAAVVAEAIEAHSLAVILAAMSALYTGGMFLNDAFDKDIDARMRPDRPIPSGAITSRAVWIIGIALLAIGVAILSLFGTASTLSGVALAAAILFYDAWHKGNPLSPLLMGTCRGLVYLGTGLALGSALTPPLVIAAFAVLFYVAGLTSAAKGGTFQSLATSWPVILLALPAIAALTDGYDISRLALLLAAIAACGIGIAIRQLQSGVPSSRERAVGLLIAIIAVMDAVVATTHGSPTVGLICLGLFILTLLLHRFVPGT